MPPHETPAYFKYNMLMNFNKIQKLLILTLFYNTKGIRFCCNILLSKPTINEIQRSGRKKKHLYHYHGPATITSKPRERQYTMEYTPNEPGATMREFTRDLAMIVPEKHMPEDLDLFDPLVDDNVQLPRLAQAGDGKPFIGEYIICNEEPTKGGWFVAQVTGLKPNQLEVDYLVTPTPPLEEHVEESVERRLGRILEARFQHTWILERGENRGKVTSKPPFKNHELRTWSGPIPHNEMDKTILIRGVQVSANGQLSPETAALAASLAGPHEATLTVENEATAATALFLHSMEEVCSCRACTKVFQGI